MVCCVNCFRNTFIIDWINENGEIDDCSYCGSINVTSVGVEECGNFIRECLSKAYINATTDDIPYHIYEAMGNIYTIDDILKWDEEIFSTEIDENGVDEKLLSDLMTESGPSWRDIAQGETDELEGGEAYLVLRDSFYAPDHNQFQYSWDNFTYTVKHVNRFFDVNGQQDRIELLSNFDVFFKLMQVVLPIGTQIWRGRLNPNGSYETSEQRIKECGPPPRNKATSMRMNPAGISYFYGAEDINTTNCEIRASNDDTTIFGLFETKKELSIVDLSQIPQIKIGSIFSPEYDHELHWAKFFLRTFTTEISRLINANEAQIEYLPTQILTEYIRSSGYDGVRYKSSLTNGYNLTLFCGPLLSEYEDKLLVNRIQIPAFTEWLKLVCFREGI